MQIIVRRDRKKTKPEEKCYGISHIKDNTKVKTEVSFFFAMYEADEYLIGSSRMVLTLPFKKLNIIF
jgi:hypothetical protein